MDNQWGRSVLWGALFLFVPGFASAQRQYPGGEEVFKQNEIVEQVIRPTVLIDFGTNPLGSGTLIGQKKNPWDSKYRFTYFVLTAFHVVRDGIHSNWSKDSKDDTAQIHFKDEDGNNLEKEEGHSVFPKTFIETVARFFGAVNYGGYFDAKQMKFHELGKKYDVALYQFESNTEYKYIAKLPPNPQMLKSVGATTEVRICGYPLGNGPHTTRGELTSLAKVKDVDYRMLSAPGDFGFSGGGVYTRSGNFLIGVFSKLFVSSGGFGSTRMSDSTVLMSEMKNVYEYLVQGGFEFLIPGYEAIVPSRKVDFLAER